MVLFVSLLLIFGKIFKRIIYNSLFNHFLSNKLFMPSQSGFIPGDSCITQLLSIIPEIQTDFYNIPTVDLEMQFNKMISKSFLQCLFSNIYFFHQTSSWLWWYLLYGKPNNENFQNKMEKVKYRACLPITGRIQRTYRGRLYHELGLDSLVNGLWRGKSLR